MCFLVAIYVHNVELDGSWREINIGTRNARTGYLRMAKRRNPAPLPNGNSTTGQWLGPVPSSKSKWLRPTRQVSIPQSHSYTMPFRAGSCALHDGVLVALNASCAMTAGSIATDFRESTSASASCWRAASPGRTRATTRPRDPLTSPPCLRF